MKKTISILFGTGFYSGLMPVAPGTFGSLAALIPLFICIKIGGLPGLLLFILISVVGNYLSYPACEEKYGADPGCFVLDEWAGMGISLIPVVLFNADLIIGIAIGFAIFRFFDITKIAGISNLENLPDAHGVLFDDVLAGVYTAICLSLFIFAAY